MDDERSWFLQLADSEKQGFLAYVSTELTIHGRAFGLELTGEQQIRALLGLNELQHQISQHIAHLCTGHGRYPDDVLWTILQEKAEGHGISSHLDSSLKSAYRLSHVK